MADSKILVQGQWMKIIDNGDGTCSFAVENTPSSEIIGKVGIDQVTANANEVVVKTIPAVALTGNSVGKQSSATITLAAGTDQHDALDVVSTAAGEVMTFAGVGAANDLVCILGSRIKYAVNALPTAHAGYRLHLYNAAPTAIADDVAFNVPATDLEKYIGYISISSLVDVGDNCISIDNNVNYTCKLAGTALYGILQCIAAETPAANAVYTISLNTVTV